MSTTGMPTIAPPRGGADVLVRPDTGTENQEDTLNATPYNVVVLDDPVTLFSYVVMVFRAVFGYTQQKALHLTGQVHHEGRAVVWSGVRGEAEVYLQHMREANLRSCLEKAD